MSILVFLQAVMVTRMCVNSRYIEEFERLLRVILKTIHTVGHVSTCVVRPPPGEFTYTSIVRAFLIAQHVSFLACFVKKVFFN